MKNLLCFLFLLIFAPSWGQRLTFTYSTSVYEGQTVEADYELTFDMRDHAVIIGNGSGRPFVFQYEKIGQHIKTQAFVADKGGVRLVFSPNYAVLFHEDKVIRYWNNFSIPKKWVK